DSVRLEGLRLTGDPERAVVQITAGAAGDLGEFGGSEIAVMEAIELASGGEGDMVDIHVEAHADRVGGDDIIDIARLIERNLGVAGTRRQDTKHDGRTAALAADQFGNRIDHLSRKGDDG